MKQLLRRLIRPVRKLFGIEQLIDQQFQLMKELKTQRHQLDRMASYLRYAAIDEARMRESYEHQNIQDIISLLAPMDVSGANYRRVGRDFDGGYIMLDDISSRNIDAAYSFGINDDVSWDEAIAGLGIEVYMYDHTIKKLPKQNPRFHFFEVGLTGNVAEAGFETLGNLINANGHRESRKLLLKMDVEGYEWSVFEEASSEVIGQFSQIAIELHGLDPSSPKDEVAKQLSVLKKLNQTHQAVHVHANGFCPVSWLGELVLPQVLEVTYVRRSDYADRLVENTRTFPTKLDQPTHHWLPDVPLGHFTPEGKGKE